MAGYMLNHPTLDQLKTLKLDGMVEAFTELETQDRTVSLSHAEWLGLLTDRETSNRATKRFESRMRTARLRHVGAPPRRMWITGRAEGWTKPCSSNF